MANRPAAHRPMAGRLMAEGLRRRGLLTGGFTAKGLMGKRGLWPKGVWVTMFAFIWPYGFVACCWPMALWAVVGYGHVMLRLAMVC